KTPRHYQVKHVESILFPKVFMVNPLLLYIYPGFSQALLRLWKAAEGPDARLGTLRAKKLVRPGRRRARRAQAFRALSRVNVRISHQLAACPDSLLPKASSTSAAEE